VDVTVDARSKLIDSLLSEADKGDPHAERLRRQLIVSRWMEDGLVTYNCVTDQYIVDGNIISTPYGTDLMDDHLFAELSLASLRRKS
jgi:hypothetical protein